MSRNQDRLAPASNQMELQLPGLSSKGFERMDEARRWVSLHRFEEWAWFMEQARIENRTGRVSAKRLMEGMRFKFRVSIKNEWSPCFARIAMEQDPSLSFAVKGSMCDGATSAVLR